MIHETHQKASEGNCGILVEVSKSHVSLTVPTFVGFHFGGKSGNQSLVSIVRFSEGRVAKMFLVMVEEGCRVVSMVWS